MVRIQERGIYGVETPFQETSWRGTIRVDHVSNAVGSRVSPERAQSSPLQHTATLCSSLAARHCKTLQDTARHCKTLQRTATVSLQDTARHCKTLHHTHCNTLQHTLQHISTAEASRVSAEHAQSFSLCERQQECVAQKIKNPIFDLFLIFLFWTYKNPVFDLFWF